MPPTRCLLLYPATELAVAAHDARAAGRHGVELNAHHLPALPAPDQRPSALAQYLAAAERGAG